MEIKEIRNEDFFTLLEQKLKDNKKVRFRIKGTSMQPFLRNNVDEVLLKKPDKSLPEIGDICLFKFEGQYILHRFIRYDNGVLFMQGDNIIGVTENCKETDVIGVVEVVYRGEKSFSGFSKFWQFRIKLHRQKLRIRHILGSIKRSIIP